MAGLLQELAKAKLARYAAQQLAGLEVDLARGGRGHAVGVVIDLGDVVAGIFGGIAVDRVGIENGKYFGHVSNSLARGMQQGSQANACGLNPACTLVIRFKGCGGAFWLPASSHVFPSAGGAFCSTFSIAWRDTFRPNLQANQEARSKWPIGAAYRAPRPGQTRERLKLCPRLQGELSHGFAEKFDRRPSPLLAG